MTNKKMLGVSCAVMTFGVGASYGYVKDKVNSGVNKIVPKSWEDSYTSNAVSHIITAAAFIGGVYFLVYHLPSFREFREDSGIRGSGRCESQESIAELLGKAYATAHKVVGEKRESFVNGIKYMLREKEGVALVTIGGEPLEPGSPNPQDEFGLQLIARGPGLIGKGTESGDQ
jgi:hypothetical protein